MLIIISDKKIMRLRWKSRHFRKIKESLFQPILKTILKTIYFYKKWSIISQMNLKFHN